MDTVDNSAIRETTMGVDANIDVRTRVCGDTYMYMYNLSSTVSKVGDASFAGALQSVQIDDGRSERHKVTATCTLKATKSSRERYRAYIQQR